LHTCEDVDNVFAREHGAAGVRRVVDDDGSRLAVNQTLHVCKIDLPVAFGLADVSRVEAYHVVCVSAKTMEEPSQIEGRVVRPVCCSAVAHPEDMYANERI
jgi:hypothetical protein